MLAASAGCLLFAASCTKPTSNSTGWEYNNPVTEPANASHAGGNVIDLSTYEGEEYWQTYHNFKVIKRYNNSKKYAMAVHQLAQAIKQRL
jgi:membrane-bound lytic murein transglycosylase B